MSCKVGDVVEFGTLHLGVLVDKGYRYSTVGFFVLGNEKYDYIENDLFNERITLSKLGYTNETHQALLDKLSEQVTTKLKFKEL